MRTLLTLALTGLLGGCFGIDDGKPAFIQLAVSQEEATLYEQNYNEKSMAGNYLAGNFAQRHHDWSTASHYMNNVLGLNPNNTDLQKRTMILAMGSEDTQMAFKQAHALEQKGQANVLAWLFLSVEAIKKDDTEAALTYIKNLTGGGISEFVEPLLKAWLYPENKSFQTNLLKGNAIHRFHALLIADYLGKDTNIFKDIDIGTLKKEGLSSSTLEIIQTILARHTPPKKGTQSSPVINTQKEGIAKALFDIATLVYQEFNDDSSRLFSSMALYLDPSLADARILLAHIASSNKRYDEAIAHYKAISPDKPFYIEAQHQIADLLEEQERYDDALLLLKDLAKKNNDTEAQIQIGDLHRRREELKNALKAYNTAAKMLGKDIPKEYWSLLYARGIVYEQLQNWDMAEKDLKAALSFEPDHPYILNYLGYSWADQGRHLDKALKMIKRAHKLRPTDGYIADSLGWVLYRMERFEEAVPAMEKAVGLLSYDPVINDHLGDVYWSVQRHMEARFQWNRAINYSEDNVLSETIRKKLQHGLKEL